MNSTTSPELLSTCCGASPTENITEDMGFCPDCREHTEFVAIEAESVSFESTWKCLYCDAISHDDHISPKDGFCYRRPNGLVGNHTFRKVEAASGEYFDRAVPTDANGVISI